MCAARAVLWQDPAVPGAERCRLAREPAGFALTGAALLAVGGAPCEARYLVRLDERWRTRHVEVTRSGPDDEASVTLDVEPAGRADGDDPAGGGRWLVDGAPREDLEDCVDVDLEFTPATNTLPIRRLALAEGRGVDVAVAWLRFPGLTVERAAQRYDRVDAAWYAFRAGGFSARLEVDGSGLVRRYGDAWRQVAATGTLAD